MKAVFQTLLTATLSILSFSGKPAMAEEPAPRAELIRPAGAQVIRMEVTAYCPCVKCCGAGAHGVTASGLPVSHNNGRFVAADVRKLPFGTRLVVPGYDASAVEVIDKGGAIKGNRLDVYFPTHKEALKWGRRTLDVIVLESL